MRIYFSGSIEVAEEDFGDWETESTGEDLIDFVLDELTRSDANISIYEAGRNNLASAAGRG